LGLLVKAGHGEAFVVRKGLIGENDGGWGFDSSRAVVPTCGGPCKQKSGPAWNGGPA
jgi:hypothetical protein